MIQAKPRRMIVGMDAGGRAREAVKAACELSARFEAPLVCVQVIELPPIEDISGRPDQLAEVYAEIEAGALEHARKVVSEIAGAQALGDVDGSGGRVQVEVHRGHAARTLLMRERVLGAEWIVLGPHEQRQAFDFGSTTRSVLGKAHGGVWVQPEAWRPIRRIAVPVDLSEESLGALASAAELAQLLDASLTVVHCFQDPDFAYIASPGYIGPGPLFSVEGACEAAEASFHKAIDAAWESGDYAGPAPERRFVRGRPVDAILGMQEDHDLIVLSSHGRTGFRGAVLGNVAYSILKRSSLPVLALKQSSTS